MSERSLNPSGYDMPKPSRFVFLDDLSNENPFLISKTIRLTELIDSPHKALRLTPTQLIGRLKKKYDRELSNGICPRLDILIGVGATGCELAEMFDSRLPKIKVTPFRANSMGTILTRSGVPLVEEVAQAKNLLRLSENKPVIGIVDDTLFSGATLIEVKKAIDISFLEAELIALTLTSVPSLWADRLTKGKIIVISAIEIKTTNEEQKGLNSVDLKDLVIDDALPLGENQNIPFMAEENWIRSWFGENYEEAMKICREIRNYIQK